MEFLLIGIFSIFALVFVAYPLINRKKFFFNPGDAYDARDVKTVLILRAKKLVVEDNIHELETEHEMGKLSDGDFDLLRGRLETETERVDAEIEKHKIKNQIDELIEHEVKSRRRIDQNH